MQYKQKVWQGNFPADLSFGASEDCHTKVASISLETPCVSHAQLYVACSGVGTLSNHYIYAPKRYLPSRYDSILRWSDNKFKFNEIQLELVAEESRLQVRASDNNEEHIEAHCISSSCKSYHKSLVCFHCNRSGHFRNKCPELQKKVSAVSSGFYRIPSTSQDCGRSLSDTFPPNPSSNNQRRTRRRTKIQNTNPSSHGNMSYLIQACTSEVSKASDTWLFDTAASHHFCKDKSIFNEYVPISDGKMTLAVEGVTIPIEGKGIVNLRFSHRILKFGEVMHSSKLNRNLISGPRLDKKGVVFEGGKGELRVKENGQLLFKAFLRDGLYVVNLTFPIENKSVLVQILSKN
ncbi:hypothetical protein AVEN_45788-1 [Araneus ventricosus]|uniref:CCHC-type domain-containing protein n=1 Tax=Araneus ventricosus TaxID=182803 RepID=A0A4Y2FGM7_ARAVE|nr:hypothetical protein AVEN_45788-1 [Araneus ventricosus]